MSDQHTAPINGVDIAYELTGTGEPVVLIHGLGSSRRDWQPQLRALEAYRVLRYDVRGHGESGRSLSGYDVPTLAADAAALLEKLALTPAHVVGLSLGGMIGFQLAVDRPELVRSLTVVNSGPEVVGRTRQERWLLTKRLLLTWALGPRTIGKLIAKKLFIKPEEEPLRRDFIAQMAKNDRRAYLATTRAVLGWSVMHRLAQVACPVLVVSGDRDYTPVARKEAYLRRLRSAELVVIADSGHATPLDQPQAFNAALVRFLDGQRGTRAGAGPAAVAPALAREIG